MLSIQSIMLVALGFLTAALLALTFAPAVWARAVRLTTQRIKERLPVTETEIRADKDRLRAEFAMTVHRLESKIESAEMKRARHMIELNRRDASISQLEGEMTTLRATLEEHENARRVLEHTVIQRLPNVESRLDEARTLLATRDAEINDLSTSTSRQQQALDEARGINAQQGAEIDRLTTSLTVRGGRNKDAVNGVGSSGDIAVQMELESLRGKARGQAELIARLQQGLDSRERVLPASAALAAATGGRVNGTPAERPFLIAPVLAPDEARAALERDLRSLKANAEDQAQEIKSLTAELAALRGVDGADVPDSKVSLRARVTGLQSQTEQQAELVRKLRAELAAANERLALQGAHFMDQMRRLGGGNGLASTPSRRAESPTPRISLAERVANSRGSPVINGTANGDDVIEVVDEAAGSGYAAGNTAGKVSAGGAHGAKPGQSSSNSPRLIDRISSLGKV